MRPSSESAGEVRWRLHLRSEPQAVFAALSTDAGRKRFWAESTEEQGETIVFHFLGLAPVEGRVVAREPPWRYAVSYFGSVVEFSLSEDRRGETDLLLVSRGVPRDEYEDVPAGWVSVLMALKAALDFGVDLRNHSVERTWKTGFVDN